MIEIKITITDQKLPDGQFYGRVEAFPENHEPVSKQERMIRDMIMEGIKITAEHIVQLEGVSKAFIAEVPSRLRRERNESPDSNTRRG